MAKKMKKLKKKAVKVPKAEGPVAEAAPQPAETTSDLTSDQWQSKFDSLLLNMDTNQPLYGEFSRVSRLAPYVPKETLRRRFYAKDISKTKMGPSPIMGKLEELLLEYLLTYKTMGVRIYVGVVAEKARKLMADAQFEGDFKASRTWLDDFCKRHGLNLREGQFLEKERSHAVSREALGRYFDLLAIAILGVAIEDIWMLDEVHVNLLDCGGYKVSLFCAPSPLAPTHYSNTILNSSPQVVCFGPNDDAWVPKPESSKHISFMPCVNAAGGHSTPVIVFQGARVMSRFAKGYPEALLGMDPAGYMSCELFLAWAMKWEEETRHADGRPRALLFDGHFSHMAIDAVIYLRSKNVRVLTVHPHTTHLTCVLDNGPFRRFNWFLKHEVASLSPPGTQVNDSNVSGCIKRAWEATLKITVDPKSGEKSSPVLSAFAKTGISPPSRELMTRDIFTMSDFYKSEKDAFGGADLPSPKRPTLTLTPEMIQTLREQLLKVDQSLSEQLQERIKLTSRTKMSELLTSDGWLSREVETSIAAAAAEAIVVQNREKKKAATLERGGLTKTEWNKQESAKKSVAKAARKEAKKAAAAALPLPEPLVPTPPLPPPVPIVKKAAVPPAPMAAEVNPYAKGYGPMRGVKRARVDE